MCEFSPKSESTQEWYKWGYHYEYKIETVKECAGPITNINSPEAHSATIKLQAVARGVKTRSMPKKQHISAAVNKDNTAITAIDTQGLPPLNAAILIWCQNHLNLVVDRGECWDLGYHAVWQSGGQRPWGDRCTIWSDVVVPVEECIPGDIIQMFSQKWQGAWGWAATGAVHTAVVAENLGNKEIRVMQCNWAHDLSVKYGLYHYGEATEGKSVFYRPCLREENEEEEEEVYYSLLDGTSMSQSVNS